MIKGSKHTEQTKAKLSLAWLSRPVMSEETRKKISLSLIGNKRTLGFKPSATTKAKLREVMSGAGNPFYGKKHTFEAIEKISKNRIGKMVGSNHPRWVFDRSQLKDDYRDRGGQLHREWSKRVKNRDGWKCKISNGDCSGRLEAHHILGWKSYPELRYEINNGITLCHFHHPRTRQKEMELSPYFQKLVLKGN